MLTGTAGVFRAYALKAVADARGYLIPGDTGQVYDTAAMTEDNELTIALKRRTTMCSPPQCRVTTELHARRCMRSGSNGCARERGALENIGAYGFTRTTTYWLQQLGIGYGTIALNSYRGDHLVATTACISSRYTVGLIFVVERVVTVWGAGWCRLLALPLVIEIGYDMVLQAVYVKSLSRHRPRSQVRVELRPERGGNAHEPQARSRTACPRTPLRPSGPVASSRSAHHSSCRCE